MRSRIVVIVLIGLTVITSSYYIYLRERSNNKPLTGTNRTVGTNTSEKQEVNSSNLQSYENSSDSRSRSNQSDNLSQENPVLSRDLSTIKPTTQDELINRLLQEKQPPVLEKLIEEIKKENSQEAIIALMEEIKGTAGPERVRYIMILGRFKDESTLPLLTDLCQDMDQGIRFTAYSALSGFNSEKSTAVLLSLLNKASEDFDKRMIEQVIMKEEVQKIIPNLISAISNEDKDVILKANEFLERFSKLTYPINIKDTTSLLDANNYWQTWWKEYLSKNN